MLSQEVIRPSSQSLASMLGPRPFSACSEDELLLRLSDPHYLASVHEWHQLLALPEGRRHFFNLCNNRDSVQYEIFTFEFVAALADYLELRRIELRKPNLTVLEVGAGSGRLSAMLRRLEGDSRALNFIATDNGAWGIPRHFPVERLEIPAALQKYRPDIALFSWMPPEIDMSGYLRGDEEHSEFILIGDRSCCGTPESWRSCSRFMATELGEISTFQLCRTDSIDALGARSQNSSTVSFRRKQATPLLPAPGAAPRHD